MNLHLSLIGAPTDIGAGKRFDPVVAPGREVVFERTNSCGVSLQLVGVILVEHLQGGHVGFEHIHRGRQDVCQQILLLDDSGVNRAVHLELEQGLKCKDTDDEHHRQKHADEEEEPGGHCQGQCPDIRGGIVARRGLIVHGENRNRRFNAGLHAGGADGGPRRRLRTECSSRLTPTLMVRLSRS
jgi:hypothetical protein